MWCTATALKSKGMLRCTAPVAYPAVDLRGYSVSVVTEAHVRDSKDYEALPMHLRNAVTTGHHDKCTTCYTLVFVRALVCS